MPKTSHPGFTKSGLLRPSARDAWTTLHLWETQQTQLPCSLPDNCVLTKKQAGWRGREKSIFPLFLKQFRCTACNSAITQGSRQTSRVRYYSWHSHETSWSLHIAEIDSCTLTFLLACRSGEKSFWQMAPLHYYIAILLAVQPAYDQVNKENTSLHWWQKFINQLAKTKDCGREQSIQG